MQAMLLAAGFGTRLDPLTAERPKPALPVANRPLGAYALEVLSRAGVQRVAVNAHHLPGVLRRHLEPHAPRSLDLVWIVEAELLGTGGGVRNGWSRLDRSEPLLVMNADVLFGPPLNTLLQEHTRTGALATMVLQPRPQDSRYGNVEIDRDGRVRRLLDEGPDPGSFRSMMFTGVHVLSPAAWADLPSAGCIIRSAYRRWVDRRENIRAYVDATPFRELGTPVSYLGTQLEMLGGAFHWAGGGQGPREGRLIHPAARIGRGARIARCVVGAGATVEESAMLTDSVVWDGARVRGEVRGAVVTPSRVLAIL